MNISKNIFQKYLLQWLSWATRRCSSAGTGGPWPWCRSTSSPSSSPWSSSWPSLYTAARWKNNQFKFFKSNLQYWGYVILINMVISWLPLIVLDSSWDNIWRHKATEYLFKLMKRYTLRCSLNMNISIEYSTCHNLSLHRYCTGLPPYWVCSVDIYTRYIYTITRPRSRLISQYLSRYNYANYCRAVTPS